MVDVGHTHKMVELAQLGDSMSGKYKRVKSSLNIESGYNRLNGFSFITESK